MAHAEQCPLWLLAHNRRVNPTRVTSLGRVVVARGLRAIVGQTNASMATGQMPTATQDLDHLDSRFDQLVEESFQVEPPRDLLDLLLANYAQAKVTGITPVFLGR